jgi:cell division protein FtsI/penicillin-binding protein 2
MGQNEQKSPEILNSPDLIRVRFRLVAFVLILVGIGLAVRFFYIQVFKREYYLTAARSIYTKNESLSGLRGEIRDRNNNLFAGNSPRLDVACSPFDLKNNDERLRLARIMNKHFPEKSIKQYYDSFCKKKKKVDEKGNIIIGKDGKPALRDNKYTLIKRHVPLEKVKELKKDLVLSRKEKKKQNLIWLVSYTPSYVRIYPKGYLLSNLIGYSDLVTGTEVDGKVVANEKLKKKKSAAEAAAVKNAAPEKKDPKAGDSKKEGDKKRKREVLIGRSGLEFEFDDTMAPGLVTNKFEKTPSGHPIIFADNKISVPDNGKDIFLTILEPIQAILEEELETAVKEWNPDGIMAAIADPRTGEILAIAQRPAFNPGDRSTFHIPALRMRFAQDVYEPGSLAKPFSVLMALEKNLVKPEDLIDCENGRWAEKKLSDSHRYDKLTVSQVIQKSSNIGTAKIAVMMGKNGVYQALRRFGFNSRSGLPLGNEVKGLLPRPAAWDSLAITRIPIGYSFNTTLLQLLRAYCGLANNGKVPYLKLIHGIRNPQTGVLKLTPPARFTDSGADPVHLYKLIDMMISVTEKGGTARQAAIPGFQVAGKTGTSRKNIEAVRDPVTKKIIRKSHYSLTEYYASFAGFVPAHEPRLVMVVTVDRPRGSMYGGTAAAPVFRRTMERTLRYLNIQPTEPVLNVSGRKRH